MKLLSNILLLFIICLTSIAAGFEPEVKAVKHRTMSSALIYFDDSANVLNLNQGILRISKDDGKQWTQIDELPGDLTSIWSDPINRKRAFAFTSSDTHYLTNDRGEHWSVVKFDGANSPSVKVQTNFKNSNLMLVTILICDTSGDDPVHRRKCGHKVFYTEDGFTSSPRLLNVENVSSCTFAKTNENFDIGDDKRVLCLTTVFDSQHFAKEMGIHESSDWFKTSSQVVDNTGLLTSSFVVKLEVVESFVVAIVRRDRYSMRSELDFFVSKDGTHFRKADFNVDMKKSLYIILPSTPDSLHIATWSFKNSRDSFPLADLYRSDSSGLYYTKSASSILGGLQGTAAIEKVQNIDGAWIANEILGFDSMGMPNLKSRISIDDGLTWDVLKLLDGDCSNDEKCSLNILSTKERDGEGNHVTGPTPGILMGVGSVGLHSASLLDLSSSQTYISRDGGLHWKQALSNPCAFSFGDQGNIILAFPYLDVPKDDRNRTSFATKDIYYSLDQGETWDTYTLEQKIFPITVTTTIDGSSTKFLLAGLYNDNDDENEPFSFSDSHEVIYSIDFSKAFGGKKCSDDDFEEWYARAENGKDGQCLFGHKEKFKRRKQDAKCFVDRLFDDVKTIEESCECHDTDYECALGFVRGEDEKCQADFRVIADNFCSSGKGKVSLPIMQKLPGSICKGGIPLTSTKQDFDCKEVLAKSKVAAISHKSQSFEGDLSQYYYLKEAENGTYSDETLILRADDTIYYSFDGGQNIYKFDSLEDPADEFIAVYLNPFFPDQIYLITSNSKLYISYDRGVNFSVVRAPSDVNEFGLRVLSFNKKNPMKYIWYGEKNCENFFSRDCKSMAYETTNGGSSFKPMLENIRNCHYVGSIFNSKKYDVDENLIYCEQKVKGADYLSLVSSNDSFNKNVEVLFDKIVGIAVTGEFVVVASVNTNERSLEAHVTIDGRDFADALFPPDFHVDRQQAYTIIDSSTGALFIHVTTNSAKDGEFGTILKSNSNGTSYVKSIDYVNRNRYGFVDYEKVQGLEGVALINVVDNPNEVEAKKSSKKLKSMITHNDGSEWNYIAAPVIDSNGKKFSCNGKNLEKCSLNLHGYTERADLRDTFSSGSAIGMLIGVGNVGDSLKPVTDESTATFMTKDGGITWKEIIKGNYMWEFGDQGTILVLAPNDAKPTTKITFSLDEGDTWSDYEFTNELVTILDLATVPSDTSRRFMLLVRNKSNVLLAYTLDFTHVHLRQCTLDFDHPVQGDFEYWTPKHPFLAENCLFGHESLYLRRISSHSDCFIGSAPLNNAYVSVRNCLCTRKDFECDYNYVKAKDGTCKLVEGLSPPDNSEVCSRDSSLVEFWEPTGYRKIPLSTCEGGKELDKWVSHPCPGKESEFEKKHRISGFALFLTIVIPITVFALASWFIYDRGIRRNGGFARFGEIRLDEDDFHPIENNQTDKLVNDIVKGLILSIGAIITLRSIVRNKIIGLFTRRNRYERVFGQDHDGILDDDSLFNFNDIDNDEDATEIDSFIERNDDDFNTVATGEEYTDDVVTGDNDTDVRLADEEEDLANQGTS